MSTIARIRIVAGILTAALLQSASCASDAGWAFEIPWKTMPGEYSIDDRLTQFGGQARARLIPHFAAVEVAYPPPEVALLAFKDTQILEVYARAINGAWHQVATYPILAASGVSGPKLREGDRQVPEGIYPVILLNPNSRFHVSLRLGYPNAFDRQMALLDGRTNLGGDIMIHGDARSMGCLAMGNEAAEEFFTLAAAVGTEHMKVVISPSDFRKIGAPADTGALPAWTAQLYEVLMLELAQYPGGF